MDRVRMAARGLMIAAALMFVVVVAGASADGFHGNHDDGDHTAFTVHTFDSFNVPHSDWSSDFDNNNGFERFDSIRDGFWLKGWKTDSFFSNNKVWCDSATPSTSPTPSAPEPAAVLLLAMGVAGLFFLDRRKALQE